MSTPRGFVGKMLVVDIDTSGLSFTNDDPSYDPNSNSTYQALAVGLIVVDTQTMTPIQTLYVEIKWDGESAWTYQAENVHKLSKKYLEENGVDKQTAVELIGNLIIDHWGPSLPVHVAGHNPAFDLAFLRRLLRSEGLEIKFGGKMFDTNTLGLVMHGAHNAQDLFSVLGITHEGKRTALTDAESALAVFRISKIISEQCFGDS